MSTKKSHRTREQLLEQREGLGTKSQMLQLEDAILALEQSGFDSDTIFGFVNCIMKGFITNGEWSEIYLAHVGEILRAKATGEEPNLIVSTPPGSIIL